MTQQLHPNYNKAANLTFISAGLGIIGVVISPKLRQDEYSIIVGVIVTAFVVGLGFLIRAGFAWVKYVLVCLFLIGLIGVSFVIFTIWVDPIGGLINLLQTILQLIVIILLFQIPAADRDYGN
ncbi:MAG TPA: hypothetical protein VF676_11165 [Flavobacterium sp.]|jgi:hypothetical protein